MATLSIKEVANRPEKPQSAITFISKIFKEGNFGADFKTEDGIFCSDFVEVTYADKTKIKYERSADNKQNQKLIEEYIVRGPGAKGIDVTGRFFGQKKKSVVKVSKFTKTSEFGGMDSSGKRINLGIKFEKDLFAKMYDCLEGKKCMDIKGKGIGPYASAANYIINASSKKIGHSAIEFKDTGKRNTPRPIVASPGSLYINPPQHSKHGALVSDIDIVHKLGGKSHLSLKYGSTLTFMNAGVSKILNETEMKTGTISNIQGKNILAAFGIDEQMFCDVFNKYGKTNERFPRVVTTAREYNSKLLNQLISTGMGSEYWMVHGQPNGSVNFWYMDPARNKAFSSITGNVIVYYGGKSGKGKRLDVDFSNQYFDFTLNIRNKQRGLYPSHIMLDYTSKEAIGKTNITNKTNLSRLI
jgi:hypothetical protein